MHRSPLAGLTRLLASLCCCALPLACAQPAPGAADAARAAAIVSLVVERACFGCPAPERLELYADGRARLTRGGQARLGTAEQVAEGRMAPAEFERLALATVAAGFYGWAERYEEPGLQDGAWVLLTVRGRGGDERQVFRREEAGPPALAALLARFEAAQARVRFLPLPR